MAIVYANIHIYENYFRQNVEFTTYKLWIKLSRCGPHNPHEAFNILMILLPILNKSFFNRKLQVFECCIFYRRSTTHNIKYKYRIQFSVAVKIKIIQIDSGDYNSIQ